MRSGWRELLRPPRRCVLLLQRHDRPALRGDGLLPGGAAGGKPQEPRHAKGLRRDRLRHHLRQNKKVKGSSSSSSGRFTGGQPGLRTRRSHCGVAFSSGVASSDDSVSCSVQFWRFVSSVMYVAYYSSNHGKPTDDRRGLLLCRGTISIRRATTDYSQYYSTTAATASAVSTGAKTD
jgi:hypothetical protein